MLRILVADDAAVMRETVRELVEELDIDALIAGEARDGAEVVKMFESLRPDVVLLDLLMPKRSGVDALRAIREIDPTAYVVACSALGQERLVAEAVFAGARDVTLKPFHPVRLETALRRVQRKRLTPAQVAA